MEADKVFLPVKCVDGMRGFIRKDYAEYLRKTFHDLPMTLSDEPPEELNLEAFSPQKYESRSTRWPKGMPVVSVPEGMHLKKYEDPLEVVARLEDSKRRAWFQEKATKEFISKNEAMRWYAKNGFLDLEVSPVPTHPVRGNGYSTLDFFHEMQVLAFFWMNEWSEGFIWLSTGSKYWYKFTTRGRLMGMVMRRNNATGKDPEYE